MEKEEKLKELLKIHEIIKSGYGGILSNGNIVDRRDHPEAIPFAKNLLFDTPEPKDLTNIN